MAKSKRDKRNSAHPPASAKILEGIVSAIVGGLVGAAVGLLSFFFAGWLEGQKQTEIRKAEAYVTFLRDTWGYETKEGATRNTQAVSAMTGYASKIVVDAYSDYGGNNCAAQDDPPYCRRLWTKVVNSVRETLGEEQLNEEAIVRALWGGPSGAGSGK